MEKYSSVYLNFLLRRRRYYHLTPDFIMYLLFILSLLCLRASACTDCSIPPCIKDIDLGTCVNCKTYCSRPHKLCKACQSAKVPQPSEPSALGSQFIGNSPKHFSPEVIFGSIFGIIGVAGLVGIIFYIRRKRPIPKYSSILRIPKRIISPAVESSQVCNLELKETVV